ncbi:hypothetical protein H261_15425 [Paramagnetospirillum caucaseum]|uniref:Uncharacterized protein n=1 Tax=Paramagnetospirillum caucaseum TaxID=1244869 RepID=M3A995_9PROT|nr:hypothetical protein H261_15425 [Paramagnetospirillum caucaseum]
MPELRELDFVPIRSGSLRIRSLDGLPFAAFRCLYSFPQEVGDLGGVGIFHRLSVLRPLGGLRFAPSPRFAEYPYELGNIDVAL